MPHKLDACHMTTQQTNQKIDTLRIFRKQFWNQKIILFLKKNFDNINTYFDCVGRFFGKLTKKDWGGQDELMMK